ncbi:cohesin domain-containing protein [Aquincola sp. MAHUQ-54]|uniref:Cohesin domain-containing protein n=1 Tax=Aquincola agrisoli TaxID=3119538 RepID=A0AAW9Q5W8_9BURK
MKSSNVVLRAGPRFGAAGLLAAALLCGSIAPAHAVPTFSLVPSATTVQQNQSFSVSVMAGDLTDLYAYQFDVSFDASLYQVTGFSLGSFLSPDGSSFYLPGTIDNTTGTVSFVLESLVGPVPGTSGSGVLGTINFSALPTASGTGSIGLNELSAYNSALEAINLAPVAMATVSVVPEPATWGMLSLGLLGVLGLRRQRSAGAFQS